MRLVNVPGVALVTCAVMVQVPGAPPGMLAPAGSVMLVPPTVPTAVPVQLVVGADVSVTPVGSVSTRSAVSTAAAVFGLFSVIVSVLISPT